MIKEQRLFLRSLSDFIMRNNPQEDQDLDWKLIFEYAKKHDLQPIISFQCREIVPEYSYLYLRQISRYVALKRELSNLEQLLSEIPYALEKGIIVSDAYPVPAFRTMGDIDILVPSDYRNVVAQILIKNGYKSVYDGDGDEWKFRKADIFVEVHSRPIHNCKGNEKLAEYYSNWEKYVINHRLEVNYHVLFLFVHLRQHLLGSGVGFRQFVDIAVITQNKKLDWKWIISEAQNLKVDEFVRIVLMFNELWFHVKSPLPTIVEESFYNIATESIFRNGVFGKENEDNNTNSIARLVANKGISVKHAKLLNYIYMLFPKYSDMIQYSDCPSYLQGRRFLIPIAWTHRIAKKVTSKRIRNNIIGTSAVANDRVEYFRNWGC